MAETPNPALVIRASARELLEAAGKLRAPHVQSDALCKTLEAIAQQLIDLAKELDEHDTG